MKTAVIMSKEEAMALPLKERPICFRISSEMYHGVFESIGEASMAWKPRPGSEVFNSEEASNVAVKLCFKIAEEVEKQVADASTTAYEKGIRDAADLVSNRNAPEDCQTCLAVAQEAILATLTKPKPKDKE